MGVGFSDASDGDLRSTPDRTRRARALGIPERWATVTQVHAASVVVAHTPGDHGAADAIVTEVVGLPVAVFTADCAGVVVHGDGAVGVAHAGWRGVAAGVVTALLERMTAIGAAPGSAVVGPAIGPCCFEVGPEVVAAVGHATTTSVGTTGVDLVAAILDDLAGLDVAVDGRCTRCDPDLHSHRRDGTRSRMAAIGWLA